MKALGNISQTRSRIGAVLGTSGAIVVLVASAQAATSKPAGMSKPEYQALMIRSEALNTRYGNTVTRLTPRQFRELYQAGADRMTPQELAALVARSEGLNDRYALGRTRQPAKADAPAAEYPAEPTAVERLVRQETARRNDLQLGITRPTQVVAAPIPTRIEVVRDDGFDWLDAALGAASAVGLAGALGGAVLLVRGRTPRHA